MMGSIPQVCVSLRLFAPLRWVLSIDPRRCYSLRKRDRLHAGGELVCCEFIGLRFSLRDRPRGAGLLSSHRDISITSGKSLRSLCAFSPEDSYPGKPFTVRSAGFRPGMAPAQAAVSPLRRAGHRFSNLRWRRGPGFACSISARIGQRADSRTRRASFRGA
jgi:hypothetical protein